MRDFILNRMIPETNPGSSFRFNLLKKLFQLLLVSLGCLHLAGGPYSLMQVYAWAGMLVSYSQDDGLLKAAKDTFSGEKPCKLCCKIAEAKKDAPEREPLAPLASVKLQDMIASEEITIVPPRFTVPPAIGFPGMNLPVESGSAAPPTPPPRELG